MASQSNAAEFAARMTARAERIDSAARIGIGLAAHAVEAAVKAEDPVVTGTMRRSETVDGPYRYGTGWRAGVGPTVIYGRRVNLGYRGPDSLGRTFTKQPPQPGPLARGFNKVRPKLTAIVNAEVRKALKV